MNRTARWLVLLLLASHAHADSPPLDRFNYCLGTQTIGASYGFTNEPRLIETAQAIHDMGSNAIKIALPAVGKKAPEGINSLTDLVSKDATYKRVLEMPFAYYFFWANTHAQPNWSDGLSADERDREYREMYEFACHLLKTQNGSNKTFFLGHWEGDWLLRGIGKVDAIPSDVAMQGMADWLNARQQAVDDAKRDTPHQRVSVFNYAEVNLVRIGMEGKPCVTTHVMPKTNVDYVSYSSYDTEHHPDQLAKALTFIESHMKAKAGLPAGKRVFIGEYGFPAIKFGEEKQDALSRQLMLVGLEWGCPFVLYWEMYNNEVKNGVQQGFWLINDKNVKQPVYRTHERFYQWAKEFVRETRAKNGRDPTHDEFSRAAVIFLKAL